MFVIYNFYALIDRSITESLGYLERPDLHPYERSEAMLKISQNVAAIWGSDEVRYVFGNCFIYFSKTNIQIKY